MQSGKLGAVASLVSEKGNLTLGDATVRNPILEDQKESLLDEECLFKESERINCPEMMFTLCNSIIVSCLLDTGAQISCISEEFYKCYFNNFKKCPLLPITGLEAIGFNGAKSPPSSNTRFW